MGAIRLFLAIGVVVAHIDGDLLKPLGMRADPMWVFNFTGGRAVLFFYVVSGFLMSYVLHEKYPAGGAGTRAFYRARFLRIYPLWWAVLLLSLVAAALRTSMADRLPATLVPATLLFGSDWLVAFWDYPRQYWGSFPAGTEAGWTLGAELTFYVIAPFALRSRRAALALLAGSAAVRLIAFLVVPRDAQALVIWTYFFFPSVLMFFMLGHFGYAISRRFAPGTLASSLVLICAMALSAWSPDGPANDLSMHLSAGFFALALPGIFAATKDSRVFNALGDLTYPLYLTHTLVISALFWPLALRGFGDGLAGWIAAVSSSKTITALMLTCIVSAVAIGAAAVAHLFVERPCRYLIGRVMDAFEGLVRVLRAA
jgi:peptidoglycan/LPS O-acetylase OafA/YrhL